ncbi:MAG TPA: hypothetical protein VJ743_17115 [Albitalea sp.]|nr:hypothetical protein [Albitalea sp.]
MTPSKLGQGRRAAMVVVRVAMWVAPLLLAACATHPTARPLPRYVAPAGGPTAKLVMRGSVPAGDSFGVYVYDNAEACTGLRAVGAGNSVRNPASTTLAANQVQTIEFFLVKPSRQFCAVRWSFTPVAGKTYLLSGGAVANTGCAARVMDASDPDDIKPEPTALRRNPGSTQCLPLALSKPSTLAGSAAEQSGHDAVLKPGATSDDLKGLMGQ